MIYKDIDNKEPVVVILERMLALAGPDKRPAIERELHTMRAGIRSEREAAYWIDAQLKHATRTAVVHDLRLDLGGGQVAQIDHVLIHRTRRFFVLDTKGFAGLKVTDEGAFLRWDAMQKAWVAIVSPPEQCQRNAAVLGTALAQLGVDDAAIEALVLVKPEARLERARRGESALAMRADAFIARLDAGLDGAVTLAPLGGLLRTGLYDSIGDIARKLVALHRPSTADYMARFGAGHEAHPASAVPTHSDA